MHVKVTLIMSFGGRLMNKNRIIAKKREKPNGPDVKASDIT